VPTIRVFEALACGIPLVSCRWADVEGLFRDGDFRMVDTPAEMRGALRELLADPAAAAAQAARGLETVLARHTCRHRGSELLDIVATIEGSRRREVVAS
jgi:spore maturation protein CgeB